MSTTRPLNGPQASIAVYLEPHNGRLTKGSLEVLASGQSLANTRNIPLCGILIGHNLKEIIQETTDYSTNKIFVYESPELQIFSEEVYAQVLAYHVKEYSPSIVLMAATSRGNDLGARLSSILKTGLMTGMFSLHYEENDLLRGYRRIFSGQVDELIEWKKGCTAISTLKLGTSEEAIKEPGRKIDIIRHDLPPLSNSHIITEKIVAVGRTTSDLRDSEIVVSGGRGIGSAEGFDLIRRLAANLGGAVGASLVSVDEGWVPREALIGQTGKTIAPRLLLSLGISGALHHLIGIRDAQTIIAVNRDRNAPIFKIADLKVIGDVNEVLPILLEAVEHSINDETNSTEKSLEKI